MKPQSVTIQMNATKQYFHVVLYIMLCKVVLTLSLLNLWIKPQCVTIQLKAIR